MLIQITNKKNVPRGSHAGYVYIGRKMPGLQASALGNPFKIGRDGSRDQCIERYERWLRAQYRRKGKVKAELLRLALQYLKTGELVLVCWCAPERCHGEVIAAAIYKLIEAGAVQLKETDGN